MSTLSVVEAVYAALGAWQRELEDEKESKRAAHSVIVELRQQIGSAISTIEQSLDLVVHQGATLQQVVDKAMHAVGARTAEDFDAIERLRIDVDSLQRRIEELESERNFAISELIKELELPPVRGRALTSAVTEATSMIHEAKRMIQENL